MAKGAKTGGRVKGVPNKATKTAREAIAAMMELAAPKMAGWLEQVAATDPAKAFDLALKAAEYHIPKLARTEHVGDGGGPVAIGVTRIELVPLDDGKG